MYDDLAKLLQKGLAKEGRFSERLSIFWKLESPMQLMSYLLKAKSTFSRKRSSMLNPYTAARI